MACFHAVHSILGTFLIQFELRRGKFVYSFFSFLIYFMASDRGTEIQINVLISNQNITKYKNEYPSILNTL